MDCRTFVPCSGWVPERDSFSRLDHTTTAELSFPAPVGTPPYTQQQAWDNALRISRALSQAQPPLSADYRKTLVSWALTHLENQYPSYAYQHVTELVRAKVQQKRLSMPPKPINYRLLPFADEFPAWQTIYVQAIEEIASLPLSADTKHYVTLIAYNLLVNEHSKRTTFARVQTILAHKMEQLRTRAFAQQAEEASIMPHGSIVTTAGSVMRNLVAAENAANDTARDHPSYPSAEDSAAGSDAPGAKRGRANAAAHAAASAAASAAAAAGLPPRVAAAAAAEATARGAQAGDNAAHHGAGKRRAVATAAHVAAEAAREDIDAAAHAKAKKQARKKAGGIASKLAKQKKEKDSGLLSGVSPNLAGHMREQHRLQELEVRNRRNDSDMPDLEPNPAAAEALAALAAEEIMAHGRKHKAPQKPLPPTPAGARKKHKPPQKPLPKTPHKKPAAAPRRRNIKAEAAQKPKKTRAKKGQGKKRAPKRGAAELLTLCAKRGVCKVVANKAANKAAAAARKHAYNECKRKEGVPRMKCVAP